MYNALHPPKQMRGNIQKGRTPTERKIENSSSHRSDTEFSSSSASVSASASISGSAALIDVASNSPNHLHKNQKLTANADVETTIETGLSEVGVYEKHELSTTQAAALQTSSSQLDIIENFSVSPATLKTSEEIIADLTGVNDVLMRVSTLSFLFQRFDMLEKQLDDLKSRDTRDLVLPTVSAAPAQTISTKNGELVVRIVALEEVIADHNKMFIEMSNTCKLLVEDNTVLKETLIGFQHTANNNKAAESNDKPRIEFSRSIDVE